MDFGRRDKATVWGDPDRGALELRVSSLRAGVTALLTGAVGLAILALILRLAGDLDDALALGWFAAVPIVLGILVLAASAAGMFWLAAIALRSLMRGGAVLRLDRSRIVVRTGEGTLVLPWATTEARIGPFFLEIDARTLSVGDDPATILVPMFFLEGGVARVREALDAVEGGEAERRSVRDGPARNAAE